VAESDARLRERLGIALEARRRRLAELGARLRARDVRLRLSEVRTRLGAASGACRLRLREQLARAERRLGPLSARLASLSPLAVLERGYAIVQDEAGGIVKDAAAAPPGTSLGVRLARGRLKVTVRESHSG